GQTTSAKLDAADPACHHHHDPIAILPFDCDKHRPAGSAAGFAVVAKTVAITNLPGPAVVRCGVVADGLNKCLGFLGTCDWRSFGDEAALADGFLIFAGLGEGSGDTYSVMMVYCNIV